MLMMMRMMIHFNSIQFNSLHQFLEITRKKMTIMAIERMIMIIMAMMIVMMRMTTTTNMTMMIVSVHT